MEIYIVYSEFAAYDMRIYIRPEGRSKFVCFDIEYSMDRKDDVEKWIDEKVKELIAVSPDNLPESLQHNYDFRRVLEWPELKIYKVL